MAVDASVKALGEFIQSQRNAAQMTLRDLSKAANVSNPYLSQIERGLHEPSLRVIRSIATALNLSVETLLVRAGVIDEDDEAAAPDTETVIARDERLTEDQRQSLLAVYRSYVG